MKTKLLVVMMILLVLTTGCISKPQTNNQVVSNADSADVDEPVSPVLSAALKKLFAVKNNVSQDDIVVLVLEETTKHATGIVEYGNPTNEIDTFLAANIDSKWQIVYEGDNDFTCEQVAGYQIPDHMISDCQ